MDPPTYVYMCVYTYIYIYTHTHIHISRIFSFISRFHWNKAISVRADISKVRLTATHNINSPLFLAQRPAYILPAVRNTMLFWSKFTIIRIELVIPNPNLTEPYCRSEAYYLDWNLMVFLWHSRWIPQIKLERLLPIFPGLLSTNRHKLRCNIFTVWDSCSVLYI